MNTNKLLLEKIDNLINLSVKFDEFFKQVINYPDAKIESQQIETIYLLTKNYILLRAEHGSIILILNRLNQVKSSELDDLKTIDDEMIEKLYDISTFNSLINNVNDLVNNIDFQYKKIALKYPRYINKKPLKIIMVVNETENEESDKYIKLIENIKKQFHENFYNIVKCDKNEKKLKPDKSLGLEQPLKITSIPTLFIINGNNIVEIPIDKVSNVESISNILKV